MAAPSPQTWMLRLKSHKTTVLLHVEPLDTFSTIKSHLYDALQDTELKHPDTDEAIPLPSSPSDIQLGRPVDINDAHQGFRLGEWEYAGEEEDEEESSVGKGKGKARAGGGPNATNVKDCPKGAGLRDGTVLAFRWAGDGSWDGDEEDAGKEGDMWGVQLATFEDAYGVENETDVGGGKEFEG
jgi:hypothetical protein